jgi:hypothetical protein
MNSNIDHIRLHRTAKYFMDNGRASTYEEAMAILQGFGLTVIVGPEVSISSSHQIALLSLVNIARRTFLGGVEVVGLPEAPLLVKLVAADTLAEAVKKLGAAVSEDANAANPVALIGTCRHEPAKGAAWQLTWQGWRGGVTPARTKVRLSEDVNNPLAAALSAAVCAAELFAWYAGEHPMAGRRSAGLSLWKPDSDWMSSEEEPVLSYLPTRLWLIGLGNLGQAFAWLLACLPYRERSEVELILQDFDFTAESNDSTSLLSSLELVGCKKARAVADWFEHLGFVTHIEERRFGEWTRRAEHEPGVALCGVDNGLARSALGKTGFDLVVEAGLGAGPDGFRNFSMHTFPSSRAPEQIWSGEAASGSANLTSLPAYVALSNAGLDDCGLAQLASRTVGVPFVGLIAATLAISELLRRLHGGEGLELVSGSVTNLGDLNAVNMAFVPYAHGHTDV